MTTETTTALAEPPVAEIAPAPVVDELVEMLRAGWQHHPNPAPSILNLGGALMMERDEALRLLTWANARRDAAVAGMKGCALQDQQIISDQMDELATRDAQIARLTEALKFYENPQVYKPSPHGCAFGDRDLSFVARAALSPATDGSP